MKPVNLLPPSERPTTAIAVPRNASPAVLAVLAFCLIAVGAFVLTKNDIAHTRSQIAEAKSEQAAATQRAAGLKAFGDFRQVKETRIKTITDLATKRFDWERFMRELALVLPDDVWLTDATSSTAGTDAATTGSATPTTGSAPSASGSSTPSTGAGAVSVKLTGCAPEQKTVAETMARLRNLHGASDVQLQDSTRPTDDGGQGGPGAADSSSDNSTDCGDHYTFNATVEFDSSNTDSGDAKRGVPGRLGGGA